MNELDFHVHDDIDFIKKESGLPIAFFDYAEVYIMQEDRIVFIGQRQFASRWIKVMKGKRIERPAYKVEKKAK